MRKGNKRILPALYEVQKDINNWYKDEADLLLLQIRMDDIVESEKVSIFHHEIHKNRIKQSAILELDTEEGIKKGHEECSLYLAKHVSMIIEQDIDLDPTAQEMLLDDVTPVFTEEDNNKLLELPDKEEVKSVLKNSKHHAAPGTDGISSYLFIASLISLEPILQK